MASVTRFGFVNSKRGIKNEKILTEWRKYIKESNEPVAYFDGGLYHGIKGAELDSMRDKGIGNLPSEQELEEDKAGVPCSTKAEDASKFGDVVLELDLDSLGQSGQYVVTPSTPRTLTLKSHHDRFSL